MSDHRLELADVFRTHEDDFLAQWGHVLSPQQRKAFGDIRDCRTAILGGHVEQYDCGHRVILYNSCTNRSCPKCQAAARAKWLAEREAELLPVDAYFHVVFTLPQEIAHLALQNAREIYGILFRAASETLLTIAADPKHLGAEIGFLTVLHTWGQNLHIHPHIHCVVPGGGVSKDGSRWIACRKKSFFLPVKVLSRLFRKKFLIYLERAFQSGKLGFHGQLEPLTKPAAFAVLCRKAGQREWVVYAKRPFGGPEQVLKYLARYTHRVAISNSRLLSLENGRVTFEWKDYADGNQSKTMTLDAVEFIRRFLLHVLPSGFVRIRHFGFLANRNRKEKLVLCRSLLPARQTATEPRASSPSGNDSKNEEQESHRCPVCKIGRLVFIEVLTAEALARLPAPVIADTS
jgi:putative transposase/transposase-like zinc-binding protein